MDFVGCHVSRVTCLAFAIGIIAAVGCGRSAPPPMATRIATIAAGGPAGGYLEALALAPNAGLAQRADPGVEHHGRREVSGLSEQLPGVDQRPRVLAGRPGARVGRARARELPAVLALRRSVGRVERG